MSSPWWKSRSFLSISPSSETDEFDSAEHELLFLCSWRVSLSQFDALIPLSAGGHHMKSSKWRHKWLSIHISNRKCLIRFLGSSCASQSPVGTLPLLHVGTSLLVASLKLLRNEVSKLKAWLRLARSFGYLHVQCLLKVLVNKRCTPWLWKTPRHSKILHVGPWWLRFGWVWLRWVMTLPLIESEMSPWWWRFGWVWLSWVKALEPLIESNRSPWRWLLWLLCWVWLRCVKTLPLIESNRSPWWWRLSLTE
jgi:hypothetical protein